MAVTRMAMKEGRRAASTNFNNIKVIYISIPIRKDP